MLLGRGADNPECSIELKTFHSSILNDHEALRIGEQGYTEIPPVEKLDNGMIQQNFTLIRCDLQEVIYNRMDKLPNDPALRHLEVNKKR